MRLAGYRRVSTADQGESGAGLAAQETQIRGYCTAMGHDLEVLCTDTATGSNLSRPGLASALESLATGCYEGLIVAKLDRLTRSVRDFAELMDRSARQGWAFIALDMGIDTSTAAGEMMAHVLAAFAQYERQLISERTKAGLAAKRAAGVRLGRPLELEDDTRDRIRRLAGQGLGPSAIAQRLSAERVPTAHGGRWWPSTVTKILSRL